MKVRKSKPHRTRVEIGRRPEPWKLLEEIAACIERTYSEGHLSVARNARVPDRDTGSAREVDVLVEGRFGSTELRMAIECRKRNRPPDARWLEQLHQKARSISADRVVALSWLSFGPTAIDKANALGIELRHLVALPDTEIEEPFRITHTRLVHTFSDDATLLATPDAINVRVPRVNVQLGVSLDEPVWLATPKGLGQVVTLKYVLEHTAEIVESALEDQKSRVGAVEEEIPVFDGLWNVVPPTPREFAIRVSGELHWIQQATVYRRSFVRRISGHTVSRMKLQRVGEVDLEVLGQVGIGCMPWFDDRWTAIVDHLPMGSSNRRLYILGEEFAHVDPSWLAGVVKSPTP